MTTSQRLDDISTRIMHLAEQRRRRSKTENGLLQIETTLKNQGQRLEELERHLRSEQLDVDRLERLSLTGLFATLLGNREEQVQKERQELLQAQLRYQNTKHAMQVNLQEQDRLRAALAELNNLDAEYDRLLEEKEKLLQAANPSLADEVLALSEKLAHSRADLIETEQAIAAGNQALEAIDEVIASLDSAEGWGTWDMLGGGLLTTAIKHSRIDDARYQVEEVEKYIERFKRELADIRTQVDISIEIGGVETFADYFFDGLLVDWMVQSSIGNSLQQAHQAKKLISKTVDHLGQLKHSLLSQIKAMQTRRAQLIEAG